MRSPRIKNATINSPAVKVAFRARSLRDNLELFEILREAPGILVIDKREDGGYVTPVECVGDFATYISRIRTDPTIDNGLNIHSDSYRYMKKGYLPHGFVRHMTEIRVVI